jgi:hypothetical protein
MPDGADIYGDSFIVEFNDGGFTIIDLKELCKWDNNVNNNDLESFIPDDIKLFELARMAYRLMVFKKPPITIEDEYEYLAQYVELLRKQLQVVRIFNFNRIPIDRYINRNPYDYRVYKFYKSCSPKPRTIIFGNTKQQINKLFIFSEITENSKKIIKLVEDSKTIIKSLA